MQEFHRGNPGADKLVEAKTAVLLGERNFNDIAPKGYINVAFRVGVAEIGARIAPVIRAALSVFLEPHGYDNRLLSVWFCRGDEQRRIALLTKSNFKHGNGQTSILGAVNLLVGLGNNNLGLESPGKWNA
ncbi:hypothetical protein CIHG_09921 [Coccidioides immitis H538.4]|uniref:Uncharacterized protein n=1 Tax=Coccidioides immitis H538.4 TaxID=396776 RepID=A0A0J8UW05_COCIT|nr:hypothetical protein CIHG_09921 [Coccidioides immitis H538.4]